MNGLYNTIPKIKHQKSKIVIFYKILANPRNCLEPSGAYPRCSSWTKDDSGRLYPAEHATTSPANQAFQSQGLASTASTGDRTHPALPLDSRARRRLWRFLSAKAESAHPGPRGHGKLLQNLDSIAQNACPHRKSPGNEMR